ncbi:hypothetical protein PAXRUDRAFT_822613 [Paxillus rubicundulus Ve08.2h10]|uniref:Phospholipase/carboxylesterase/thioesterase domain-containing protein n=1 Tax=Paxillus rubicundulus Ve08.2h10 TaxID=930991 RepID=A0A0D0DLN3_9AGAM|nr:hypothetical protein PAXRUDRAFT_822613 [Paxillus rubicundulus Ve08.2h10]
MADIYLRATDPVASSPHRKPAPSSSGIPLTFSYAPSSDGTDENILILLHGLGDSHLPFAKLGQSVNLPQTAVLALRAPEQIPYLYEQAFQWYSSFDPLGDIIEHPNPTPALELIAKVLNHLTTDCTWPPNRIHIFGFGQGGSVAAESALAWWKRELARARMKSRIEEVNKGEKDCGAPSNSEDVQVPRSLGSVVSVSGPLLSYSTLDTPCQTPLLLFHRASLAKGAFTSFSKGFVRAQEIVKSDGQGEESMPCSRDEWQPVMQFWSEALGRRMGDGLYEVTGDTMYSLGR